MQLVIDIPDDVYDECKGDVYFPDTGGIVWEGVRNGTPLPKDQEPCEDSISRQAVDDAIYDYSRACDVDYAQIMVYIDKLPSVNPQEPKTGHWIEKADEYYRAINEKGGGVIDTTPYFVDDIACSECLTMFSTIDNETERFEFCPNCGAKMQ